MPIVTHLPTDRALAITIDDGPTPETTPMLLSILKSFGAKATFFVVGRNVKAHPELAEAIVRAGHDLSNHAYSHRSFLKLSPQEITGELDECEALLSQFRPTPPRQVIRPPYGHVDDKTLEILHAWHEGCLVVKWAISGLEWRYLSDCQIPRHVLEHCRRNVDHIDKLWNKAILLMHDWPTRTTDPNLTAGAFGPMVCATLMERYLEHAQAKGLACLRISDCDWKI